MYSACLKKENSNLIMCWTLCHHVLCPYATRYNSLKLAVSIPDDTPLHKLVGYSSSQPIDRRGVNQVTSFITALLHRITLISVVYLLLPRTHTISTLYSHCKLHGCASNLDYSHQYALQFDYGHSTCLKNPVISLFFP